MNRRETPFDDDEGAPSALVESVLALLEQSGIDTQTCDKICAIIEAAEQ